MLGRNPKYTVAAAFTAVLGILLFAGCQNDSEAPPADSAAGPHRAASDVDSQEKIHVAASGYGSAWPLTVDAGTLRCWRLDPQLAGSDYDHSGWAVTFTPDRGNATYKIGGPLDAEEHGWKARYAILREDPSDPRETMDLGPLVEDAKRLCSPPLAASP